MRRRSAGAHPKWKRKTKRPGSFAESGPLEFRERLARRSDAAASRRGAILGLAMHVRLPGRQALQAQRDGARERTRAVEGLGVAKGDPAVHDGVSGSIPFRGRTEQGSRAWASCEESSPFQATARSVNSLYGLRKRPAPDCCWTSTRTAMARVAAPRRRPSVHKQNRSAQRKLSCLRGPGRVSRICLIARQARRAASKRQSPRPTSRSPQWHLTSHSGR